MKQKLASVSCQGSVLGGLEISTPKLALQQVSDCDSDGFGAVRVKIIGDQLLKSIKVNFRYMKCNELHLRIHLRHT